MVATVLARSFSFFRTYWPKLLLIALLTEGITDLLVGSPLPIMSGSLKRLGLGAGLVSVIISSLGIFLLQAFMARLIFEHAQGERLYFREALGRVVPRLFRAFGADLFAGIITVAGLVLFIIPGVIAGFWFFLVVQVAVNERRQGISKVLGRSRQLVKGHFLQIVGTMLVVTLPLIVLNAAIRYFDGSLMHPNMPSGWAAYGIGIISSLFSAIVPAFIYNELAQRLEQPLQPTRGIAES